MRIAIISNFITPYSIGGAEIATEILARNLSEKKQKVFLVTSGKCKKPRLTSINPNLKILRFFPKNIYFNYPPGKKRPKIIKMIWWIVNLWNPFVFQNLRRILKTIKPDVILIQNFYSLSVSVFTASLIQNVPVFFTTHDHFPICKNSILRSKHGKLCDRQCLSCRIWSLWNRLFITKRVRFIFPSRFTKNKYRNWFFRGGSLMVNPIFPCLHDIRKQRMQKIRISKKKTIFLYLGRLGPHKGIGTLLSAFSRISDPNTVMLIAGEGEFIQDVLNARRKDARIRYLGFISGLKKQRVLQASDIMVFPSECFEVSPVTIVEAFSFGLPVIATDIGSIPEHIDPGKTGFLFPYRDAASLSEKMKFMIYQQKTRRNMSQHCFLKAEEYNWDKSIDAYIKAMKHSLISETTQ